MIIYFALLEVILEITNSIFLDCINYFWSIFWSYAPCIIPTSALALWVRYIFSKDYIKCPKCKRPIPFGRNGCPHCDIVFKDTPYKDVDPNATGWHRVMDLKQKNLEEKSKRGPVKTKRENCFKKWLDRKSFEKTIKRKEP